MFTTTPAKITTEIRKFCNQISSKSNPIYLEVKSLPTSIKNECFKNVQNYISQNGGTIQYGWRIWECAGIMVEAEFHSVWVSPEGEFVDISPAEEKNILFLPDNSKIYEGKQINNIRLAFSNNPLVKEFIYLNNRFFEEMNKGELIDKFGAVAVPAHIITPLMQRKDEVGLKLFEIFAKPNSPCYCGSGRKFKKCCKNR
ncbi:hypothetical protein BH20ACI4_BH20ACI4_20930 [soil metagenome]